MSSASASPLTALETVRSVSGPIGSFGGAFMLHPETLSPCKDAGYPNGFAYYVAGRGGVLGDVDADVVSASFGPFSPSLVRTMWEAGVVVEGAMASARRYADACAAFGRKRLSGYANVGRFAELAERIVNAAPTYGHSLFVGWRSLSWPQDTEARAFFLLHLMREWRGSAHIIAVAASGLTPLESILALDESHDGGVEKAKRFGWQEPFPNSEHLREKRIAAENLTDELQVPVYDVALSAQERGEFVSLVQSLTNYLRDVLASESR